QRGGPQIEHMGEVSEGEAAMDQRRVGDLQRVAGVDQLLRRSGHGVCPVNRVGAPPVTRNTTGPVIPVWSRASLISAAIALAPNIGSRNTPSVRATSRAASAPASDGIP